MTHVIVERCFADRVTGDDVLDLARQGGGCFDAHRVVWHGSLIAADACHVFCRFESTDAESVRIALRETRAEFTRLWPATVHEGPAAASLSANVLVARSFEAPVNLHELQAIEDAGAWCLEARSVEFVRTFFSLDRKRMVCLYRAPDAESVRQAQRRAKMPLDDVWSFEVVHL